MEYPGVQVLIDLLKQVDDSAESSMGFDMSEFYAGRKDTTHPCGTACCIDGWAEWALRQQGTEIDPLTDSIATLCDLPAGSYTLTAAIALPEAIVDFYDKKIRLKHFTRPVAIRMLEIFRDTGRVFWQRAYDEVVHGIIYGVTADDDPFYERRLDGKQVLIQRNILQEWVGYFEQRFIRNFGNDSVQALDWFRDFKGE